jgi:predicted CoA-binding protein
MSSDDALAPTRERPATTTTMTQVEDFLAQRRVAIVGASRDPKELSYMLWQELRQRRYEAIPVNPSTTQLDGQRCYASVAEIEPPVGAALVMTPPAASEQVVEECAAAGIRHVWLYRGVSGGSVSEGAIARAHAHGISLVVGHCPYMFLPGTQLQHRIHGAVKKLTGGYPKAGVVR